MTTWARAGHHLVVGLCLLGCGIATVPPPSDVPLDVRPLLRSTPSPATAARRVPVAGPDGPCDWTVEGDVMTHPELGSFPADEPWDPDEPRYGTPRTNEAVPVDLDGDPRRDAIVGLGLCGNWMDCWHVVLQACGGGTYRAVWGPEYAQGLDVGRRRKTVPMADLIRHGRTGVAGCDLPLETVMRWGPEGWRDGETCAGQSDVWDDAYCGPRPPACDGARPSR